MFHINDLKEYEDKKLVKVSTHEWNPDIQIACYTKTCFFGDNTWDDVTKKMRGTVFYKGYQVNKPFDKIFNLGEVEETDAEHVIERMKREQWEVLDKVNGHLFIVSIIPTDDGMTAVYSTKGSLPNAENDMLRDDMKVFLEKYGDSLLDVVEFQQEFLDENDEWLGRTFLFESVCEHDKHTLWEKEVETYGANDFVLLGSYWTQHDVETHQVIDHIDFGHDDLFAQALLLGGCPVTKRITDGIDRPISSWFEDTGTEGYIIRFDNGDRVKIKTSEYWKMRFKKDLTPDAIRQTFATKGIEGLRDKLPEEISDTIIDAVFKDYKDWLIFQYCNLFELDTYIMDEYNGVLDAKTIFTDENLEHHQKHIAKALYVDQLELDDVIMKSLKSKDTRKKFAQSTTDVYDKHINDVYTNVVRDF